MIKIGQKEIGKIKTGGKFQKDLSCSICSRQAADWSETYLEKSEKFIILM